MRLRLSRPPGVFGFAPNGVDVLVQHVFFGLHPVQAAVPLRNRRDIRGGQRIF
jgi:hypothetical protein